MFALASRHYGLSSETFVTAHARRIAPGRTALVTWSPGPVAGFAGPVLCDLGGRPQAFDAQGKAAPPPRLPLGRLAWFRDRAVARYLQDIGAGCMMAEFGGLGVEMLNGARRADVPLFVHFHGYDATSHLRFPKIVRAYQRLFGAAQGVFTPSAFIADKLIGVGCPPGLIHVTPCGVEPADFPLSERRPGQCLAVGRFVEKKAPHLTLRAFFAAARNRPEARLDLVGDGPLLAGCQAEAAASGLGAQVRFHGAQPHQVVRALMREASVFLQHSVTGADGDTEGLPVAILEAMCSGVTVISTRHSGIPEAVEEGRSGLLVDEGDSVAMAEMLGRVLADPAWGADLGQAARQRIEARFSIARISALQRTIMGLPDPAAAG